MESLESKLERLSPDQRKETEDFVDFLLFRSENSPHDRITPPPQVQPVVSAAPPVFTCPEPEHAPLTAIPVIQDPGHSGDQPLLAGSGDWITRDYMDYGQFEQQSSPSTEAIKKVKAKSIQSGEQDKSRQMLDWID